MARRKFHSYEFKYEGAFNSLDAITVLHSQINFVTILKEIKDHQFPEARLDVRINGVEKGSLNINHLVEIAAVTGMFVLDHHEYIASIFKIFGDIIKLKKFLKGEKAESVKQLSDDRIVINLKGDNITIHTGAFNIYKDSPVINSSFNNTGKILKDNPEIQFIQVTEKKSKKHVFKIDKSEFEILQDPNAYLDKKTDVQVYAKQILFIKKPNLFPENNRRWIWELIHQGRDIKAIIDDQSFLKKINDGLKVGQGDRLEADLRIHYKFDERFQTFVESNKYDVINISKVIDRPKDGQLKIR